MNRPATTRTTTTRPVPGSPRRPRRGGRPRLHGVHAARQRPVPPRRLMALAAAALTAIALTGCSASAHPGTPTATHTIIAAAGTPTPTLASTPAPTPTPTSAPTSASATALTGRSAACNTAPANPDGTTDLGPRPGAEGRKLIGPDGYPDGYVTAAGDTVSAVLDRLCTSLDALEAMNPGFPYYCGISAGPLQPGHVITTDPAALPATPLPCDW